MISLFGDTNMWLWVFGCTVLLFLLSKLLFWRKSFDFTKKNTFFLTGCASGIGLKMTETLLENNQNVIATDINFQELTKLSKVWSEKYKSFSIYHLDVSNRMEWEQVYSDALKKYSQIDFHLNIAGYLKPGFFWKLEPGEIERHMDINVKGLIFGTQMATQHMIKRKSGHIVNIASSASLVPVHGCAPYCASKSAVRSFSLTASSELKEFNIYVTAICPPMVRTPMMDLQLPFPESDVSFSAPIVSTEEVVRQIVSILGRDVPELCFPSSFGWQLKFANLFPGSKFVDLVFKLAVAKGRWRKLGILNEKKRL